MDSSKVSHISVIFFFQTRTSRGVIAFILCIIAGCRVNAQEPPDLNPLDAAAYQEILEEIEAVRLDINRASADDLIILPWISPEVGHQIEAYRTESGPFRDLEDLLQVAGMTRETLRAAAPYLTVKAPVRVSAKTRLRLSESSAAPNGLQALRISHRSEAALPNLAELAVLTERDPGEPDLTDFWTGYLVTSRIPGTDRLIFGDFRPGFGQGLILSRHYRTASTFDAARPQTPRRVAYRSSVENGAFRGLYAERTWRGLAFSVIISRNSWDAQIHEAGAEIKIGGVHSSKTGQMRKDMLGERTIGLRVSQDLSGGTLGATLLRSRFNPSVVLHDRSTGQNSLVGVDWSLRLRQFAFFGECARSTESQLAWAAGVLLKGDRFRLVGLARRYGPRFQSLRGKGFSAYSGSPKNEWGIFLGGEWRPARRTKLEASLDRYGRIRPERLASLPSRGARARFRLTRRLGQALRFRLASGARIQIPSETGSRRRIRGDLSWSGDRGQLQVWTERSWLTSSDQTASGFAGGFNVQMGRPSGFRVDIWGTTFGISGYGVRIFTFVPSVWGGSQLLTLAGRGNAGGIRAGWSGDWCRITVRHAVRHASSTTMSWAIQVELGRL